MSAAEETKPVEVWSILVIDRRTVNRTAFEDANRYDGDENRN
jgi:hypothetical protein